MSKCIVKVTYLEKSWNDLQIEMDYKKPKKTEDTILYISEHHQLGVHQCNPALLAYSTRI
jgi:hypothetical protein